jgi:hypothetical protein
MRLSHDVANEYESFGHLNLTWLQATYVHVMKFVWKLRISFCVVRTWADDGQAFRMANCSCGYTHYDIPFRRHYKLKLLVVLCQGKHYNCVFYSYISLTELTEWAFFACSACRTREGKAMSVHPPTLFIFRAFNVFRLYLVMVPSSSEMSVYL